MIKITDVGGREKYINCDLIERIDIIPDTLVVFVNGHNCLIRETAEELVEKIIDYKRKCSVANQNGCALNIVDKSSE